MNILEYIDMLIDEGRTPEDAEEIAYLASADDFCSED